MSSGSGVRSTATSDTENNRPNSTGLWNTLTVTLTTLSNAHSKGFLLRVVVGCDLLRIAAHRIRSSPVKASSRPSTLQNRL